MSDNNTVIDMKKHISVSKPTVNMEIDLEGLVAELQESNEGVEERLVAMETKLQAQDEKLDLILEALTTPSNNTKTPKAKSEKQIAADKWKATALKKKIELKGITNAEIALLVGRSAGLVGIHLNLPENRIQWDTQYTNTANTDAKEQQDK